MDRFKYLVFGMLVGFALISGINSFAIVDPYQQAPPSITAPFTDLKLTTDVDSDTAGAAGYLAQEARGLLVTTAGNFKIVTHDDASAKTIPLPLGWHPVRIRQVYATGTTGTGYLGY